MFSTDSFAATPDCVSDTVSIPTHPHGRRVHRWTIEPFSNESNPSRDCCIALQLNLLRLSLALASSELDIERATVCNPIVSDDGPPIGEGMTASSCPRPNEEPAVSISLPWQRRILAFFTMYGELSVACAPEEFAFVRTRLQREWTFDGGFVSRLNNYLSF
jgi:hypothetical protein